MLFLYNKYEYNTFKWAVVTIATFKSCMTTISTKHTYESLMKICKTKI